jgi:oligo-1,6-glucosidase
MQWNAEANGGFSTGRPWLAVNPNYPQINAATQVDDRDSVFHHHRRLIALRREQPALIHGAFTDIDPPHERVFGYTRTLAGTKLLVLINMGRDALDYDLPGGLTVSGTLLSNVPDAAAPEGSTSVPLAGWQATIFTLG